MNPNRNPSSEERESAQSRPYGMPESVIVNDQGQPYTHKQNAYDKVKGLVDHILDRIPHGERLMIVLTAIIALSAIGQGIESHANNKNTSIQVDRLIVSADRVDDAAESFALSASEINKGINEAVDKLDVQAKATQQSAGAAKSAALTAKNAFEVQSRPWIEMDISQRSPLIFDEKGVHISVSFQLKNVGTTAVSNSTYRGEIIPYAFQQGSREWIVTQETRVCSSAHIDHPGPIRLIPPLFPNQPPWQSGEWVQGISKQEVESAIRERESGPVAHEGYITLLYVACLGYDASFGVSSYHHTGSVYMLGIPLKEGIMGDILPKGTQSEVRLIPMDSFAN